MPKSETLKGTAQADNDSLHVSNIKRLRGLCSEWWRLQKSVEKWAAGLHRTKEWLDSGLVAQKVVDLAAINHKRAKENLDAHMELVRGAVRAALGD